MALGVLLATGCSGKGHGGGAPASIPVVVATAALQEVPLTVDAPATLLAINHVAVRARIDGELLEAPFVEGGEVRAGQLLFRIDPKPYEALLTEAQAALARDEAVLARNRAQRQRNDDLLAKGYISADDYAQLTANLRTAEAAVAGDRAALVAAQLNLDYCTIRAPIAGRTGVIAERPGNLLKAADNLTLVTITQMDPVYVDFSVPQSWLEAIRRGLKDATVSIATRDGPDAAYGHASRLDFIDNSVDAATGTIHLRSTVANADRTLWPGQFVHARLQIAGANTSVTVPAAAIGHSTDGSYLFVVDAGGHAKQQPVTIVRETADVALIAAGAKAGDRVVVDGQSRLRDGAPVSIVSAGAAP